MVIESDIDLVPSILDCSVFFLLLILSICDVNSSIWDCNSFNFKDGLTKNAIKRIKILKNSDDGFFIAEEDLKLRCFGDLIGFQQSGVKNFRFSDPVVHQDLFNLAEKYVQKIKDDVNQKKYAFLLKLFDRAEIINVGET